MNATSLELNVHQLAVARSNAYRLFSRLFQRGLEPELWPLIESIPELAAASPVNRPRLDPDSLAADHYHLFGFNVFPYESILLDKESSLGGPVNEEVAAFYQLNGFRPLGSNESPDHIGQELALLAFLCAAEADAWEDRLAGEVQRMQRLQRRFMDEHLLRWLPGLALAVRQQKATFYTALADLALELALEHHTGLPLDLFSSHPDFQLPPAQDLLSRENTGLKDIAHFLLTPAWSGFYLSHDDIRRLAIASQLPRGFGSREQMLTNLLRAAADYEKLPGLFENMHTMLQVWISTYDDYARENHPLAEMAASWLERLHATRSLLDRISAASNSSGSEA